jgi:mono/diheme cytochrome c family protein
MKPQGSRNSEHADPHEQYNPVPRVVIGLVLALIVWAVSYIVIQGADGVPSLGDRRQPATLAEGVGPGQRQVNGGQIYTANCQACHQANGQGLPGVFPPLAGSPWVTGNPSVLKQILLHGLTGPIEVSGTTYNGAMPAFGKQLSDEEIAAVATHIRSQWGNSAPAVDAPSVAAAREATTSRSEPWHGTEELTKLAPAQE